MLGLPLGQQRVQRRRVRCLAQALAEIAVAEHLRQLRQQQQVLLGEVLGHHQCEHQVDRLPVRGAGRYLRTGAARVRTDVGIARETGAIIADRSDFARALSELLRRAPASIKLEQYPYSNFESYLAAYVADVEKVRHAANE